MAITTQKVEIQFGASSWVDVTADAGNITINRGTTRVMDDYQAGQLNVDFTNNNRRFDPLNTSSDLWYSAGGYSMVQPAGKVRVTSNSTIVFYGYISNWVFNFGSAGLDGSATLTAGDLMYYLSRISFTGGTQVVGGFTGNRISDTLTAYNLPSNKTTGRAVKTVVGGDVQSPGDNVLAYMQQVARSEPGDLFASASSSAVMIFRDRTYTDYSWQANNRQNLIAYPATATVGTSVAIAGVPNGWTYYNKGTATPYILGHATAKASAIALNVDTELTFAEVNQAKYNPSNSPSLSYVVSLYAKGSGATGAGITLFATLLDAKGASIGTPASVTTAAPNATTWQQVIGTASSGTAIPAGISVLTTSAGTTTAFGYETDAWQVEISTTYDGTYFDGSYKPYASTSGLKREVAWMGYPYQSASVMGVNTASSTPTPATYLTFADLNSQGASYGNGTGIPFIDLDVTNSGDTLYNTTQIVGTNATATATDTTGTAIYGLRSYAQTDNLTTSVTRPQEIASDLLGYWRLPEYRVQAFTVALEALTTAQQNLVLGLELRDVIRLCFQPSAMGSVVDKYYQILGISHNADVERHHVSFQVGSLSNVPFRVDSTLLGVLNTSILG
ncbi:hypothetical protein UFOVP219_34 [uncultured Caudovirales phage]|uniref:Uncharacterized protein n=1 Tax=uncultured Caudovirales phage TaxID=2100421 RepID=A0A6J7WLE3_9CAUD|nr:hypothetical protein UFOVP219_34 [uncultured Caudovirales phage]